VAVEVIGAGLAAAVTWNLVTWRLGLPSSSGHALVGELVGAAAVVEGGVHAINWGGIEHWRPVGVFGILIGLALSPVLGGVAALLLTAGQIETLAAPTWAKVVCAAALTAGTALGGWRIIATVGRRIYRIRPEEALSSQTASAGVIFGSSLLGAPVSTTQVVASSVVGIGVGRRRWHHVHWAVVRNMGLAWLITMPVSAALGAVALELWRVVT
jgi:PiT family inorganic phosphate transporter